MVTNAAALVNLFATPVALERIAWKTYYVWVTTWAVQAVCYYFVMVETKGHTLEEINYLFRPRNPRNVSLVYEDKAEEDAER